MKKIIILFIIIITVVIFFACNKDDGGVTPVQSKGNYVFIKDLNASDTVHYTFFRFRDSSVVPFTDSNSKKWDIAFNKTKVIFNSGVSGPGNAGVILLRNCIFDTLSEAPATGYAYDTSATKLAITASSGKGWYNYDFAASIITPIPGVVLVIRTAEEPPRYVKMRFISYYKGNPNPIKQEDISKYYWFEYFYQSDGSRKLKN